MVKRSGVQKKLGLVQRTLRKPQRVGLRPAEGVCIRKFFESLIHMVSVWSASQHLVLGQQKVSEKSTEITAIPALLKLLSVKGCLVSIDAMGCQTEIAKVIIEQGADYVLALKGNQGDLHTDVVQLFSGARKQNFKNIEHQFHSTVSKGHGRIETRSYWIMGDTEYLLGAQKWSGLKSIGMVESQREVNGKISIEQRYYILSLENNVHRFAAAVRSHALYRESTPLDFGCRFC